MDWKKLGSKVIHKNPFFSLREDDVIKPNGSESKYWVVDKHESVFIIPVDEDGNIFLIKQFRYPTKTWSWELPAGSTDGEAPIFAAKRELQEETGFTAGDWKKIHGFPTGPGLSNNWVHVYVAKNLAQRGEDKKEEEGIVDCKAFSIEQIKKMVIHNDLQDGPSMAVLLTYLWCYNE